MKRFAGLYVILTGALSVASPVAYAQGTLAQTIDLKAWAGVPVTMCSRLHRCLHRVFP
jgi:hypothetical protein